MLAEVPVASRCIKSVAPLYVMVMAHAGKLPPAVVPADPGALGYRPPTLSDMESFAWVAACRADVIEGLASYREYWDMHSGCDVTEITSLSGSRRSIVDLVRWIQFDAESRSRRALGSFAINNVGLRRLLSKLGHVESRVLVEVA